MLVLSRDVNQQIVIGKAGDVLTGPIVITYVEQRRTHARIGIEADRHVSVDRKEIRDAKEQ